MIIILGHKKQTRTTLGKARESLDVPVRIHFNLIPLLRSTGPGFQRWCRPHRPHPRRWHDMFIRFVRQSSDRIKQRQAGRQEFISFQAAACLWCHEGWMDEEAEEQQRRVREQSKRKDTNRRTDKDDCQRYEINCCTRSFIVVLYSILLSCFLVDVFRICVWYTRGLPGILKSRAIKRAYCCGVLLIPSRVAKTRKSVWTKGRVEEDAQKRVQFM